MDITLESIRESHPAIAEALTQEGYQAGLAAGAEAERTRILAVQSQAMPGHDALVAQLVADGKTTGPEAAVQILAAERGKGAARADALKKDAPAPVPHAATETVIATEGLPIEEKAKAEWDSKPALRDEFINFSTYLAYAKANAAGSVKVLGATK